MLISQANDYAVRSLIYIVKNSQYKKIFTTKEVAEKLKISRIFLAKIFQKLANKGLINSMKGVKGGVMIIKDTDKITLYDIFEAVDGIPVLRKCIYNRKICSLNYDCGMNKFFNKTQKLLENELKKVTIVNLAKKSNY